VRFREDDVGTSSIRDATKQQVAVLLFAALPISAGKHFPQASVMFVLDMFS